jgi:uncharacterized membrane protein YfcA
MHTYLSTIILGSVVGLLAGLSGSTGSLFLTPGLLLLNIEKTHSEAAGTTLAIFAIPVTFAAAYYYYKLGKVKLDITFILVIVLAIFTYIGARYHTMLSATHHYFLGAFTTFTVSMYYLYIGIQSLNKSKNKK